MGTFLRRTLVLILGLILVAAPTLVRDEMWNYNIRPYTPPEVPELSFAATPVPTAVPVPVQEMVAERNRELRAGPVVLDLAHYNSINPSSLQPLADALADQGLGLRYWLSNVDVMSVLNYLDYPDQSEVLAAELADASALIIISPFFLWSSQEIALVEQFVADGGRLLLISDPDISGDYAAATNMIGEPFGVVFNEDYLYDTTENDGNFTFFYQNAAQQLTENPATELENSLVDLTDSTIAFYGGRSLSGDLSAVLRSVDTTLSSLRIGQNNFVTAGIGGVPERNTAGRVLALTDLDVLTEPYRQRHDNQRLVEYVADFLSADQRINRVVDFPDYLGKDVSLAFGASAAINADLILQGAQIQQVLEQNGRTLSLRDSAPLTGTLSVEDSQNDLIYLAAYTTAISQTTLLSDLGVELFHEVVTKTVEIEQEPPVAPAEVPASEADEASLGTETSTETSTTDEEPTDAAIDNTPELEENEPLPEPLPEATPTVPLTDTRPVTTTSQIDPIQITAMQPLTDSTEITETVDLTVTSDVSTTVEDVAEDTVEDPIANDGETGETDVDVSATETLTASIEITPTAIVTPTPQFEIRTIITDYLRLASGLTFIADETVLIVRTQRSTEEGTATATDGRADGVIDVLAVLAANNRGIDSGVARLLTNDFSDCVVGEELSFCALAATGSEGAGSDETQGGSASESSGTTGSESETDGSGAGEGEGSPADTPTPPRGADAPILLIDDNRTAAGGELSEADLYLQTLIAGNYQVDLWSIADQGVPTITDFGSYGWVIWSNGSYADGTITPSDLDIIFAYINENGRITISSRSPLPGLEEFAPLTDIVINDAIPALVEGLPDSAIVLNEGAGTAAVLNALAEEDDATRVALRRGPASDNAEAPVLVVLADPSDPASEARLMLAAFSVAWLPAEEQATLINNMASWMLTE